MKTGAIIGVCSVAVVGVIGLAIAGSYISAHNDAVKYEANISKFDESSKNTLSSYTLKLKEAARVPDKYVADLKGVVEATFQGRYGENGSGAAMQWIKEQNLPMDSTLYSKLQTIIDGGRNEFKMSQDRKLEYCAQYETVRGLFWKGTMMSIAGFPKKDVDRLCKIVVDSSTSDKFNSGIDSEVKF